MTVKSDFEYLYLEDERKRRQQHYGPPPRRKLKKVIIRRVRHVKRGSSNAND